MTTIRPDPTKPTSPRGSPSVDFATQYLWHTKFAQPPRQGIRSRTRLDRVPHQINAGRPFLWASASAAGKRVKSAVSSIRRIDEDEAAALFGRNIGVERHPAVNRQHFSTTVAAQTLFQHGRRARFEFAGDEAILPPQPRRGDERRIPDKFAGSESADPRRD